jgi:hypothetical protein
MTPERIENYRWWAGGMHEADGRTAMELINEIERLQKLAEEILEDFQCTYMHLPSDLIRKWKLVEADEKYQKALFS